MQSDPRDEPWPLDDDSEGTPVIRDSGNGVAPSSGPAGSVPPPLRPSDHDAEPAGSKQAAVPPPPQMPAPPSARPPIGQPGATPPQMPDANPPPAWSGDGSVAEPPGPSGPVEPPAPGLESVAPTSSVGAGAPQVQPVGAEVSPAPPADPADSMSEPSDVEPEGTERPSATPAMAAPGEGDWLSSICPYLQSEDGAYRSSQPDEHHRCTAQDPPGSLPLAFQERFCLTDRHPRCEMYKYAQEAAGVAPTPIGQLPGDTAAPEGRSISSALGSAGGGSRRPALVAAAGIGGVAIIVFAFVLLLGSCSGDSEAPGTEGPSAEPQLTEEPTAEPTREPEPTSEPTPTAEPDPGQSPDASEAPEVPMVEIVYEVQEGEALLRIAETFGVTRRRIIKANEGMEEKQPYVLAGDIIIVPVSSELTVEELEAVPGYQGLAP